MDRSGRALTVRVGQAFAARFGERGTALHVAAFTFLFLGLLVRVAVRVIGNLPDATAEANALGPCLALGSACVPLFKVHAHLIAFPALLRLLRLAPQEAWLVGPLMVAIAYPLLWAYLAARCRVPMALATGLVLAIFNLPVLSGMSAVPNADVLCNLLVIILVVVIRELPGAWGLTALIYLLALLTHQRVMLLLPGLALLRMASGGAQTLTPVMAVARRAVAAVLPFVAALALFMVFKEVFYAVLWRDENIYNKLDMASQLFRMLGLRGDPAVSGSIQEGGLFRYVVDSTNWVIWGPLYFTAMVAAWLHWRRGAVVAAAAYMLLFVGTVAQLLVAEDVHRLTSFFYVMMLLLAAEAQDMEKHHRVIAISFLIAGILYVFLPNLLRAAGL